MLGLVFDIVGAFFLAAEAIKIENIQKLRMHYLKRAHTASLSPKIRWTGSHVYVEASRRFLFFFTTLHYVAGFAVLVVVNSVLDGRLMEWFFQYTRWLLTKQWYWIALGIPLTIIYGGVFGVWIVGECVHLTVTWSLNCSVKLLKFVERRTPDGAVGILGFLLLLLGFALQVVGTYLGGIETNTTGV